MLIIGVTGGVGCGKSAILAELKNDCICSVIHTDEVANAVKEPGGICYNEIVALLGEDVLGEDRRIDRKKMAEKIFTDEALLKRVNAVLHPAVRSYVLDVIEAERGRGVLDILFIEAALLLENGYASEKRREAIEAAGIRPIHENGITVDEMWYVYAPEDVRRKRLKENRAYGDEKIDSIMKRQLTEEQFRAGSDFEIDNSGTLAEAAAQARKRINEILDI
ncbi:MAG: dephospho-CoA kinase [Lachnospiraceae bacterium]|nr:dephospho-CoA kinase [Lachnospiraceae bacterium]